MGFQVTTFFEGQGEIFEGDTGAGKFPLTLMGGWAEGLACAEPGQGPPSAWAEFLKWKQDGKPVYLHRKISKKIQQNTRLATGNNIREIEKIKSEEYKR